VTWSYRPALDGLRTVAVYAVVLFHTGHPWAAGGFLGVDLFFVLSGFLVTGVLLSEIDRTGRLRLGNFYSRRVRRLLPAALVAIVVTCLAFVLVLPVTERVSLVADGQRSLLYVANWHFLSQSGDYFAADADQSPFLHFWSLAIEEQFYLAFPLLLLLLTRAGRRWTFVVLVGTLLASVAAQVVWAQVDPTHAYYGTDARIYQPLAGSVLALLLVHRPDQRAVGRWGAVAPVALGAFLLLSSGLVPMEPWLRGLLATLVAVTLVASVVLAGSGRLAGALSHPVPVYLGQISYGTYLWHWPVIKLLEETVTTRPVLVAALALPVSTALAALSNQFVERPVRRSAYLDRFSWTPAVVGVAASAVLAVTVVPGVLGQDRRPPLADVDDTGAVTARSAVQVPDDVQWDQVVSDYGDVGWCTTEDPSECTVVEGEGAHVLLIGDSQAQSLVPMFTQIAEEQDLTLSLNVVEGCLWQEQLRNRKSSEEEQANCEEARVDWYDEVLPDLDPDVVVIMSRPRVEAEEWEDVVERRDGREQPLEVMTRRATLRTLRDLERVVPTTLVVDRLAMPETFDPPDCLTTETDPSRCSVEDPPGIATSDLLVHELAARRPGVRPVDLNPAFCPGAPVCLPVVEDQVVWRDDHHVTAAYAVSRRDQVWQILQETGAFDVP
jgi:peptidoglycan/LPS O-acetylase OafA/YrhL